MHDPRHSTALRQLAGLGQEPEPPRWAWAVVAVEPTGRLLLPAAARDALGARDGERVAVSGLTRGDVLALRPGGPGRRLQVARRGRVYVPRWLRECAGSRLVVGARQADRTVVVTSTAVFDRLGDLLAG